MPVKSITHNSARCNIGRYCKPVPCEQMSIHWRLQSDGIWLCFLTINTTMSLSSPSYCPQMLPNSSPDWHLRLLSHCFNVSGAQSRRYSEPATTSLVSYFFQRPRKFCQQSLLIRLLSFTTSSMLKVLLSHWNLITTFPSPEVLQKNPTAPKPHWPEFPSNLLQP